jgi:hypothetical protein
MFACGAKDRLINLPVVFDDVDIDAIPVLEGGDVFGAGVPSHLSALALKSFGEDDSLVRHHIDAIGE